ncbi:unnamed protein product, partial [Amoebophrya sp. A120]
EEDQELLATRGRRRKKKDDTTGSPGPRDSSAGEQVGNKNKSLDNLQSGKMLRRQNAGVFVSKRLQALFANDAGDEKEAQRSSVQNDLLQNMRIDSEYYKKHTRKQHTTLGGFRGAKMHSTLCDSMGFMKQNYDARNIFKEKEQYLADEDGENPPKRAIMEPLLAMRERNITHRPLTAAFVRTRARSDFGYGIRPVIGMRG